MNSKEINQPPKDKKSRHAWRLEQQRLHEITQDPDNPKKCTAYGIFYNDVCKYIGITSLKLSVRKTQHKYDCCTKSSSNYNAPIYKFMRVHEGFNKFVFKALETKICNDIDRAKLERKWFDHYDAILLLLNVQVPGQTQEEIKAYHAGYRAEHQEEIKGYYAEHQEEIKAYNAGYYAGTHARDPKISNSDAYTKGYNAGASKHAAISALTLNIATLNMTINNNTTN